MCFQQVHFEEQSYMPMSLILLSRRSRSMLSQRAGSTQLQPRHILRLSLRLCMPSWRPPQSS